VLLGVAGARIKSTPTIEYDNHKKPTSTDKDQKANDKHQS
ncbi:hypothetical protein RCH97_07065, partial [Staphylococcus aureus]|nr:hypothetical protein [Staphylococcus aureus]